MGAEMRMLGFSFIVALCAVIGVILLDFACWKEAIQIRGIKIRVEWKWSDKWIGVYDEIKTTWDPLAPAKLGKRLVKNLRESTKRKIHHVWICVVPCLPIHIWWEVKK